MDQAAHDSLVSALAAVGLGRSLQRLFVDHGTTPEQVAMAMPFPLDPTLFYRVDAQRQPLPADVAAAVAAALTVDWQGNPTTVAVGTVNGAARLVTSATGPFVRRPLPPLPVSNPSPYFGEQYVPPELAPYQAVRPPGGGLQLWSFGTVGSLAAFAKVDRAGNATAGTLSGGVKYGPLGIAPCAYDGSLVWTAGPNVLGPAGGFWIQSLATTPPAVSGFNNAATVPGSPSLQVMPVGMAYEPATARIWIADFWNMAAHRIDPIGMTADASVPLTSGGNQYAATGLVAVGGKLYASGVHNLGASGEDGRLFEIDPAGATVLRVSGGPSLGAAVGVDYDPGSESFFVGGAAGHEFSGGSIAVVDRTSLVGGLLSLTSPGGGGLPSPSGFQFPVVAYGALWVVSGPQLALKISLAGELLAWFQPPSPAGVAAQRVAPDGQGYLWIPDGAGELRLVSPSDAGLRLAQAFAVGAPAEGALALQEGTAPALVP